MDPLRDLLFFPKWTQTHRSWWSLKNSSYMQPESFLLGIEWGATLEHNNHLNSHTTATQQLLCTFDSFKLGEFIYSIYLPNKTTFI